MNIDGNATISTAHASSQTDSADLSESSDALLELQEELRTIRQEQNRLVNVNTQHQEMINGCKSCRNKLEHIKTLAWRESRREAVEAADCLQQGRKHFK